MELFNRIEPRALYLVMAGTLVLSLLAAYLYLFKKPLKEVGLLKSSRILLHAKVDAGSGLSDDIERMEGRVDRLALRLSGQVPNLNQSEMVAHIVGSLDLISAGHEVALTAVRPGSPRSLPMFEEIPFSLEVTGSYYGLFDWLKQVERELGPMVVRHFEISPGGGAERLNMKLDMVSYRPEEVL